MADVAAPMTEHVSAGSSAPPRKPRTAYFIFASQLREQLKAQTHTHTETHTEGDAAAAPAKAQGKSVTEIARETAERWKGLTAEERDTYVRMAAEEKEAWSKWIQEHADDAAAVAEEKQSGKKSEGDAAWLPAGRVKRIAKLDPAVGTVSKDALQLLTSGVELFIDALIQDASSFAKMAKRKGISEQDVYRAINDSEMWSFLRSDFPMEVINEKVAQAARAKGSSKEAESEDAARDENAEPSSTTVDTPPKHASVLRLLQRGLETGAVRPRTEESVPVDNTAATAEARASSTSAVGKGAASKKAASRSTGLLGTFVKVISAEEARERAEASLASIQVDKTAVTTAGTKRRAGGCLRIGEDGEDGEGDAVADEDRDAEEAAYEEESINLAAIRARIMGGAKKTTTKRLRGRAARRRAAWVADHADEQTEVAEQPEEEEDFDLGQD